ncbi:unnamed protein product [Ostreobium quekettii]|uniref:Uncharacterized protein n=1 Tax=Ostreobium quekettii TaxID=121088 RepID=A0A8S1INZ8_9CHLO|nr:unnamed protein product [Ostreobium quekettii]
MGRWGPLVSVRLAFQYPAWIASEVSDGGVFHNVVNSPCSPLQRECLRQPFLVIFLLLSRRTRTPSLQAFHNGFAPSAMAECAERNLGGELGPIFGFPIFGRSSGWTVKTTVGIDVPWF